MKNNNEELWERISRQLTEWAKQSSLFVYGQDKSVHWLAQRIRQNGVIIADEVGLGKTRLALLVMFAALKEGAQVAAVVPPGLLFSGSRKPETWPLPWRGSILVSSAN